MQFLFALPLFLTAVFALNATQAENSVAQTDLNALQDGGCNTLRKSLIFSASLMTSRKKYKKI
jgi:hypothetical protein